MNITKKDITKKVRENKKLGILLTMADFYRQRRPQLSGELSKKWQKRIRAAFGGKYDLYFTDTAHSAEDFTKGVRQCVEEECTVLIVVPMVYTSSGAAQEAIVKAPLPVLLVSSAWDYRLPRELKGQDLFANQSLHGVQDIANVLRREGRPFSILAGHFEEDTFLEAFFKGCEAGVAASYFFRGKVGQLGGSLPGMLDFGYNLEGKSELFQFEKIDIPPNIVTNLASTVIEAEKFQYIDWIKESFQLGPGITDDELDTNARYSLALEKLVGKENLAGLAMNFAALLDSTVGTLPFLGASRLLSQGIGYGGEGDVLTALLNASIASIHPETTFSELYCPNYAEEEILLSHMGECNINLANPAMPIKLKPRVFPWGDITRPLVPVFQMKPGEVTIISISETPGGETFQLISLEGEIREGPEQEQLEVPYSHLRLRGGGSISRMIEEYSRHGGTHHIVISYGNMREQVQRLAEFCGMEHYEL